MCTTRCCVPGCFESGGSHRVLHRFPRPDQDADRFRSWVHEVGGEILSHSNEHIFKYFRVCHLHFEHKYCYKNRLSRAAVPTLFLQGPLSISKHTSIYKITKDTQTPTKVSGTWSGTRERAHAAAVLRETPSARANRTHPPGDGHRTWLKLMEGYDIGHLKEENTRRHKIIKDTSVSPTQDKEEKSNLFVYTLNTEASDPDEDILKREPVLDFKMETEFEIFIEDANSNTCTKERDIQYGPNIDEDVACRLEHISRHGLTELERNLITNRHQIPSNCAGIGAPQLNPELQAAITEPVLAKDRAIEWKQRQISASIACLGKVITDQVNVYGGNYDVIKSLMDVAKMLCDVQHEESFERRERIMSDRKEFEQLSTTGIDRYLFGQNVCEALQADVKQEPIETTTSGSSSDNSNDGDGPSIKHQITFLDS